MFGKPEYLDELLTKLEHSGVSAYIGTTYCCIPTCANGIVLLTLSTLSLKIMLDVVCDYAGRECYEIHPTKSEVMVFNSPFASEDWNQAKIWTIYI